MDLFGNEIVFDENMDRKLKGHTFPLFDVIDLRNKYSESKQLRDCISANMASVTRENKLGFSPVCSIGNNVSIMNPLIPKFIYEYYCPSGGWILDPFEGSHIRPAIAKLFGYNYTGIEIRKDQLDHNKVVLYNIKGKGAIIEHILGDSLQEIDRLAREYDLVFTSPPYYNLEIYSDMEGDGSNISSYDEYIKWLNLILLQASAKIKNGGYLVVNITETRDKKGRLMNVLGDIVSEMIENNMQYHQHIIQLNPLGTASLRQSTVEKNRKLVKTHDDILVFKKSDPLDK